MLVSRNLCRVALAVLILVPLSLQTDAVSAEKFNIKSSTQVMWGDDLNGEGEPVFAEYLRFNYRGETKEDGSGFSFTGYGRGSKDEGSGAFRDTDWAGRLYYMYVGYSPFERLDLSLGRQFVSTTAHTSVIDGLTLDYHDIFGVVGISLIGGSEVSFGIDSDYSSDTGVVTGIDIALENIPGLRSSLSWAKKYDGEETARETFGLNFSAYKKMFMPYLDMKYDYLTDTLSEGAVGFDIFPTLSQKVKIEYYQSYPVFDTTSIYSTFAVDLYSEAFIQYEYTFSKPITLLLALKKQDYLDGETADVYRVGAHGKVTESVAINAAVDSGKGYAGELIGGELYFDYRMSDALTLSGGLQADTYSRNFDDVDTVNAGRVWLGGKYGIGKSSYINGRVEGNQNDNFDSRYMGRVAFDITF